MHCRPWTGQRLLGLSASERAELWRRWRAGEPVWRIAQALPRRDGTVRDELDRTGGISPRERRRSARSLSLAEREEISRGLVAQRSLSSTAECSLVLMTSVTDLRRPLQEIEQRTA